MKNLKGYAIILLIVIISLLSACAITPDNVLISNKNNTEATEIIEMTSIISTETTTETTTITTTETTTEPTTEPTTVTTTEPTTEPTTIEVIQNPDFRNTKWGMSPEQVIANETADYYDKAEPTVVQNFLVYTGNISGLNTNILYHFDSQQRLYEAVYSIDDNHNYSLQLYISDYDDLKKFLTAKYGVPYEDKVFTLNSLATYTDEATALQLGYTAYRVKWKTDNTEITLGMLSSNNKIDTLISYKSTTITPETDLSDF